MHLTVRMAWHDSNWNGRVCNDPCGNTYCTGAHSLLSGRIEKKKNIEEELRKKGKPILGNFVPDSVPPCFWSINAFSGLSFKVEHHHAFSNKYRPIPSIPDEVKPYSVFTWPFKLSFVHNESNQKKHGSYPPDLERRISTFTSSFIPSQSIVFFYANYDNPVSADEMKYLLLGCSVIKKVHEPTHFPFTDQELKQWRNSGNKVGSVLKMKNFPKINWALQFTHDPDSAVLLPYKEYIKYAETNPEDNKLDEMKVVIEEESLVRGFKYVAMDIDDDKCLYLLYKLRKSIKKIQEHAELVIGDDMGEQERRIEQLIKMTWAKRGMYPALPKVLNHFLENPHDAEEIAKALSAQASPKNDMQSLLTAVVENKIPEELEAFEDDLADLAEVRLFRKNIRALATLSLFNLTQHQVSRIIENGALLNEIASNPYALYEEYVAVDDDLDIPQMQDEPIDVYKIDVGMIPDKNFVKRHRNLQNLAEDSPQRIRSVYIDHLEQIGDKGHCYDHTENLIEEVREHPLVYKLNGVTIDQEALTNLESDYKSHFIEKLKIVRGEATDFYYLKRIYDMEEKIKKVINVLVVRPNHNDSSFQTEDYIRTALEGDLLAKIISGESEKELFSEERRQLYKNIFAKSLFVLTGKPGSGKTFETSKVVEHLDALGEEVIVLAPTGKAALRMTENIRHNTNLTTFEAKTIDRYLFDKLRDVMTGKRSLGAMAEHEKLTVENLVIDECSMVDLEKLHTLFSVIKFDSEYPKRVILVGDENQLPPIGFGKPFHDIIQHILSDPALNDHYSNLKSNCRQENDPKILTLADAFTDRRRYFEEALDLSTKTGWVSTGLFIATWSDAASLQGQIKDVISQLIAKEGIASDTEDVVAINRLFGLYDNGNVNNSNYLFHDTLKLEALQLLSPYRTAHFGTLGLNEFIHGNYRDRPEWR